MKICIDAGHNYSGADTGALGNGMREQDVTFSIANELNALFKGVGIETIMTRHTLETNLGTTEASSLNERCRIANTNNCDWFVSIHCNSFPDKSSRGTETLVIQKGGLAEALAEKVNTSIVKSLGTVNRGVKEQNVAVLRNTNMPAILVETAFISNASDAELLRNRVKDFAEAIFKGICEQEKIETGGSGMSKFPDTNGHWAEKHIDKLAEYGIVNGYSDGTFKPDNPVTRAEVSAMIANALSVMGK